MWEDLCALESRLGLRYLTHETEDMFWQDQGAKPHPLAQQNHSPHSTPDSRTPTSTPPTPHSHTTSPNSKRMVKFMNNSNGALPPAKGDETISQGSALNILNPTSVDDDSSADKDSIDSGDSAGNKGTYLKRKDQEVVQALAHAERIGYKVSTV